MKSKFLYRIIVNGHQQCCVQRTRRNWLYRFLEGWESFSIRGRYLDGDISFHLYSRVVISDNEEDSRDLRLAIQLLMRIKERDEQHAINMMRSREITEVYRE